MSYRHYLGKGGDVRLTAGGEVVTVPCARVSRPDCSCEPVEELNGESLTNAQGQIDSPSAGWRWVLELGVLNLDSGDSAWLGELINLLNNNREVDIFPSYTIAVPGPCFHNLRVTYGPRVIELTQCMQRGQIVKFGFKGACRVGAVSTYFSPEDDTVQHYMSPDGVNYHSPDGVNLTVEGGEE